MIRLYMLSLLLVSTQLWSMQNKQRCMRARTFPVEHEGPAKIVQKTQRLIEIYQEMSPGQLRYGAAIFLKSIRTNIRFLEKQRREHLDADSQKNLRQILLWEQNLQQAYGSKEHKAQSVEKKYGVEREHRNDHKKPLSVAERRQSCRERVMAYAQRARAAIFFYIKK